MNKLFALITRKIIIKIPVWVVLLLPFIAYLIWECYWYQKVGLRIVKWHTHVVEYAYVWLAGAFAFRILSGRNFSEKAKNRFLSFTSVVVALGIIEIFMQVSGMNRTYMERVSGDYTSPYAPQIKTWYHVWSNSTREHWLTKPEFSYWRPTNSCGFSDEEWNVAKKPKQKRILALGDSFTEGDGSPYDSTYVALLRKKLVTTGDSFYVMNAGICGSDPFNNYVVLRDCLLVYQPDLILQVLASNDMNTDIIVRGGMERFQKDGTQKFHAGPWWEPIYAFSYISRIFFNISGYNELLMKNKISEQEEAKLNEQATGLFQDYSTLCRKNHVRLIVLLRPDRSEIEDNKYAYNFSSVLSHLKTDSTVKVFDLLPAYRNYIEKSHSTVADYFWVHDGHHNSIGYEMMAQTIFENISPLLKDTAGVMERKTVTP